MSWREATLLLAAILAIASISFFLGFRRGVLVAARPPRETHGPMQIVVTDAQDGFAAMPEKISHPVTINVVSSPDGGNVECRSKP